MDNPKRIVILSLLFLLAFGQQLYKLYFVFLNENFVDFNVYWQATKAALSGVNVYHQLYLETIPFNYPPTFLPFLSFLTLFSQPAASLVLLFVSLSSLLASIFLLVKLQFEKSKRSILFLLMSVFFIQYFPTKFTLTLGQINLFLLFLIIFCFYTLRNNQDIFAGISLAVASLIKIFPAFLVLFFLKKRKKIAISSFLITSVLGVLVTILFFKPVLLFDYFGNVGKNLFLKAGGTSYFDQSLNSFLLRLGLPDNWRLLCRIGFSTMAMVMFLQAKDEAIAFFGLATAVMIFLPSFVWFHHYVILIPLMITLWSKMSQQPFFFPKILLFIGYLACSFHFRHLQTPILQNIFLTSHPFIGAIILTFLAILNSKSNDE